MGRQQIDLMGSIVATRAGSARKLADGMGNGRRAALEGVKVIASPGTAGEIEVVIVVAEALPAEGRTAPPFLVPEVDLIRECHFLAGREEVHHQFSSGLSGAQILEEYSSEAVKSRVEIVPTLVVGLR